MDKLESFVSDFAKENVFFLNPFGFRRQFKFDTLDLLRTIRHVCSTRPETLTVAGTMTNGHGDTQDDCHMRFKWNGDIGYVPEEVFRLELLSGGIKEYPLSAVERYW